MVPLCRLIENRYPQNRISVKPAARFVYPIDFNRFLTFRNPPSLHGKTHLYRISGTRQNGKTPPASCIDPPPVSPGKPRFGKPVGPAFPVNMFSKEKIAGKYRKRMGRHVIRKKNIVVKTTKYTLSPLGVWLHEYFDKNEIIILFFMIS